MFARSSLEVVLAQVVSVEQDSPFVRIVEPREKLHECRLAGAVLPDEREHLTGAEGEVEVAHRPSLGAGVNEADVLETKTLADRDGKRSRIRR